MSIEALKQALEALEIGWSPKYVNGVDAREKGMKAITSIRQAIADFEKQEPVGALTLGGIIDTSDGLEYEGWDVEWDTKVIEALQEKLVTSDSVEVMLYTHPQPKREPLTVRLISFPESNGKTNWTAMFVRAQPWDGLMNNAGGITIDRGECWNRVAYSAERARFLLGERATEPSIMDYCKDIRTPEEWDGTDNEADHGIKENT